MVSSSALRTSFRQLSTLSPKALRCPSNRGKTRNQEGPAPTGPSAHRRPRPASNRRSDERDDNRQQGQAAVSPIPRLKLGHEAPAERRESRADTNAGDRPISTSDPPRRQTRDARRRWPSAADADELGVALCPELGCDAGADSAVTKVLADRLTCDAQQALRRCRSKQHQPGRPPNFFPDRRNPLIRQRRSPSLPLRNGRTTVHQPRPICRNGIRLLARALPPPHQCGSRRSPIRGARGCRIGRHAAASGARPKPTSAYASAPSSMARAIRARLPDSRTSSTLAATLPSSRRCRFRRGAAASGSNDNTPRVAALGQNGVPGRVGRRRLLSHGEEQPARDGCYLDDG